MENTIHEIMKDGHVHTIRISPVEFRGASLRVEFWGRDAWIPVCTVEGSEKDSCDVAISNGVYASEDYRYGLEATERLERESEARDEDGYGYYGD
jgi:hypothetical protein